MARRRFHAIGGARPTLDLLLLTYAAGTMDALSYMHTGVFTANMTGNTVVLGLSIAGAERWRALATAVSLASFAAGVALGALAIMRLKSDATWHEDLKFGAALELPFMAAFAGLYFVSPPAFSGATSLALIAAAACGLGVQSIAVRRHRIAGVATTFMTGTITAAISGLIAKGAGTADSEQPGSPVILFAMLAVYVFSAAVAAGLSRAHVDAICFLPLLIVAAVEIRCFAVE